MALLSSISFYLTIIIFFFGQLFRLNINHLSFPLFDIILLVFTLVSTIPTALKKSSKKSFHPFIYFIIFSWIIFVLNTLFRHYSLAPGILYLTRLSCLILTLVYPPSLNSKQQNFLWLIIFSNIIFGLVQYFIWPDFTSFGALNWDPHLYRLISTFFDPTFTAMIYLIFLIAIYFQKNIPLPIRLLFLTVGYLALALTYSRATYIALFVASIFYSIKSKKLAPIILITVLLILTILILPRQPGEGTKLERTSSITAKIENYKEGLILLSKSPLFGYGYNNIVHARATKNPSSHANSAFDGSALTIFVTNGLFGGIIFIIAFIKYFKESPLPKQILLIALFFHSLFANSLLYPWILFLIAII